MHTLENAERKNEENNNNLNHILINILIFHQYSSNFLFPCPLNDENGATIHFRRETEKENGVLCVSIIVFLHTEGNF